MNLFVQSNATIAKSINTKQQAYELATLRDIGGNASGTRMDIIFKAMDLYAEQFKTQRQPTDAISDAEKKTIKQRTRELYLANYKDYAFINADESFTDGIELGLTMGLQPTLTDEQIEQMAEKEWIWTDELVMEYAKWYRFSSTRTSIKQFKEDYLSKEQKQ